MAFTRADLEQRIKELFDVDEISSMINLQIQKYVRDYKLSYLDIARCLYYFYEEQEGDINKARGIGIVPYVIDDTRKFFDNLAATKLKEQQQAQQLKDKKEIVIKCTKPEKTRRKKNIIAIDMIKEENNE